jgi:hypothetical protein
MTQKLQTVEAIFNFLQKDPDFKVVSQSESDAFGNACDVWKTSGFSIRFVRDRGDVSVDIGANQITQDWNDLGLVKALLHGNDVAHKFSLDELAQFLRVNCEAIARMFAEDEVDNTEELLAGLRQQRVRRMFPRAFGAE